MSAEVVRIEGIGDYLDYLYGGDDNVKNLSDEEVKSVLNLTTAHMLLSDQLRLLCEAATSCMSLIGYQALAHGQSELAEYTKKNISEFESACSVPLSDHKVYNYHMAAVQAIVMREKRMPHGVNIRWVEPGDEDAEEGGEIGCYAEPSASKEAKE